MYAEAASELRRLIGSLETQVYPMIKEQHKFTKPLLAAKVNQLVSNYYLLGNCMHLLDKKANTADNSTEEAAKSYGPIDFLRRAAKLCERFCDNETLLRNIKKCIETIKADESSKSDVQHKNAQQIQLEASDKTAQKLRKSLDFKQQIASEKKKAAGLPRKRTPSLASDDLNSHFNSTLKQSHLQDSKLISQTIKVKKSASNKQFRVNTANQIESALNQIKNLFAGTRS